MDERLRGAAKDGNIELLYELIREDPCLLERIDEIPFVDTPLHIAACFGRTHFAIEVISLKPSFGRKLNPAGLSPLHMALQTRAELGDYADPERANPAERTERDELTETVKWLIKIESELIRVQGKERMTPLLYLAETDDSHLLAEFLYACPASIQDLTVGGETAVHVAVRKGSSRALEVLLGWLDWTSKTDVLNWKDAKGNTVLHIAASTDQSQADKAKQMVKMLIKKVNKNEKNLARLTALDISEENVAIEVADILRRAGALPGSLLPDVISPAEFLKSPPRFHEFLMILSVYHRRKTASRKMQNAVLVVAVLIATATYQAALSPPGGVWQDDNNNLMNTTATNIREATQPSHQAGEVVMPKGKYNFFMFCNSAAFATSLAVIALILQFSPYSAMLQLALFLLTIAYISGMAFITPKARFRLVLMSVPYFLISPICISHIMVFLQFFVGNNGQNKYRREMLKRVVGW